MCNRVLICPVIEEDRSTKKLHFKVDARVSCMKYLDGRMYIGLKTGTLLIYSRDKGLCYAAAAASAASKLLRMVYDGSVIAQRILWAAPPT